MTITHEIDTSKFDLRQKALVRAVFGELLHKTGVTYDSMEFDVDRSTFTIENPSDRILITPELVLAQMAIDDELRDKYTELNPD